VLAGRSLGEAMYQARWSILRSYKNPLGILYTLHADADIRVRRPVPSALARRPTIDGFA
jgi:hypothetical protein